MPIFIHTGSLTKIICRSRDDDGEFMLLQAHHQDLGFISLRAKNKNIPNHLLPYMIGFPIDFCWSDSIQDVGSILGISNQNPAFVSALFNIAISLSLSNDRHQKVPFCADPFSKGLHENHSEIESTEGNEEGNNGADEDESFDLF